MYSYLCTHYRPKTRLGWNTAVSFSALHVYLSEGGLIVAWATSERRCYVKHCQRTKQRFQVSFNISLLLVDMCASLAISIHLVTHSTNVNWRLRWSLHSSLRIGWHIFFIHYPEQRSEIFVVEWSYAHSATKRGINISQISLINWRILSKKRLAALTTMWTR